MQNIQPCLPTYMCCLTDCRIRKGLLTDTIYVILKNAPMLEKENENIGIAGSGGKRGEAR